MVVTGGVVVVVVVVDDSLGGVVDVVVGAVLDVGSVGSVGVVVVVVGVVVDVVSPVLSSVSLEDPCGATTLPNVVPEPPDSDSPRSHSTPVTATMPSANAATVVTTSTGHRNLRFSSGGRSSATDSSSDVDSASTSSPGSGAGSGSSVDTRTVAPPDRPTTFARTVRTLSLVRWIDLRYTAPPTVEMTLARPAPTTVPATPMVEPISAAVTAASAPAST